MSGEKTDGAWFAPKRFGYGPGLPIAWQGWAAIVLHGAVVVFSFILQSMGMAGSRLAGLALFAMSTVTVLVVSARKTRGGWKWRWGND